MKLYAVIDAVEYEVELERSPVEVGRDERVALNPSNPYYKRRANPVIGRSEEYAQTPLTDGRTLMASVKAWLFEPTPQLERR